MRVSRSSLIRLVRALPDPESKPVRVLGVDDFAFRRGHTYGTILVDIDTHRPIDLLDTREAGPLRAWLEAHPEVRVICRDRAGAYTEAASTAAPDATQVADRYHLWANLVRAVEECLMHHRTALAEPLEPAEPAISAQAEDEVAEPLRSQGKMVTRARAHHHRLVHKLLAEGHSLREVTRQLGWSRNTVRRYANAERWENMVTPHRPRPSKLDPYRTYLNSQWRTGRTNVRHLYAEIAAMGYTGSYATTAAYLARFRPGAPEKSTVPRSVAPTVREVTGWMTRRPTSLGENERLRLKALLARSRPLETAHELVTAFARMLTDRTGQDLPTWIEAALAAELPGLRRFAKGLTKDFDAVTAGLTLPYNSGAVEGHVGRLKALKRQMYGRANLDLLKIRVLLDRLPQSVCPGHAITPSSSRSQPRQPPMSFQAISSERRIERSAYS